MKSFYFEVTTSFDEIAISNATRLSIILFRDVFYSKVFMNS